MKVFENTLDLIGNTPIVKLNRFDTGKCTLYAKLESSNPGGSIKDRIGLAMIKAAEREGKLKTGGTIVEGTAGNTGVGLAIAANQLGYKLILVIPDKMSKEKIYLAKAYGAEVVMTRSDVQKGHPAYYQELAQSIAEGIENSFYINQFNNLNNAIAHEQTTAPEIHQQMGDNLGAIVGGVGTSGTLTGICRYFKANAPDVEIIAADPEGSVVAEFINTGKITQEAGTWLVEGIGEDYIPDQADLSHAKKAYTISNKEAFLTARELLKKESLFAGSSSGAVLAAALRYCKEQTEPKNVVMIVSDDGSKYLSKLYNDYWMYDHGFLERETFGDLRDIITRFNDEHALVTVKPKETILAAVTRMNVHEVSQLPVVNEHNELCGIIDESDIFLATNDQKGLFEKSVESIMSSQLETLPHTASIEEVKTIFNKGLVPIITENDKFIGLITKIDLVNYLRKQQL